MLLILVQEDLAEEPEPRQEPEVAAAPPAPAVPEKVAPVPWRVVGVRHRAVVGVVVLECGHVGP